MRRLLPPFSSTSSVHDKNCVGLVSHTQHPSPSLADDVHHLHEPERTVSSACHGSVAQDPGLRWIDVPVLAASAARPETLYGELAESQPCSSMLHPHPTGPLRASLGGPIARLLFPTPTVTKSPNPRGRAHADGSAECGRSRLLPVRRGNSGL